MIRNLMDNKFTNKVIDLENDEAKIRFFFVYKYEKFKRNSTHRTHESFVFLKSNIRLRINVFK